MHHLRQWKAIGGLEVGALGVGDREQTTLRHLFIRDAEQLAAFFSPSFIRWIVVHVRLTTEPVCANRQTHGRKAVVMVRRREQMA